MNPMFNQSLPIAIPLSAAAYLLVIYLLLFVAQRSAGVTRSRE